jgi:thiol-disulfide isomerase/thioredoxin
MTLNVILGEEKITRYYPARKQYLQTAAGARPLLLVGFDEFGLFRPLGDSRLAGAAPPTLALGGRQKVGELECEVLDLTTKTPAGVTEQLRYFISPSDSLVRRVERTTETARGRQSMSFTLKKLEKDPELAETAFQWTVPEGATPVQLNVLIRPGNPQAGGQPAARPDYTAGLPAVGKTVPDFDLPRPGGGRIGLLALAKQKKVTLVNFWFVGCPPCRAEFPHLQRLQEELKDRSFQIVAVNRGDTEEKISDFLKTNSYTFNVAMGGVGENYAVGKAYGVRAYPTNILIDSTGKVLWRSVGFRDITPLRDALKAAGIE